MFRLLFFREGIHVFHLFSPTSPRVPHHRLLRPMLSLRFLFVPDPFSLTPTVQKHCHTNANRADDILFGGWISGMCIVRGVENVSVTKLLGERQQNAAVTWTWDLSHPTRMFLFLPRDLIFLISKVSSKTYYILECPSWAKWDMRVRLFFVLWLQDSKNANISFSYYIFIRP